jgi:hypothetical protein
MTNQPELFGGREARDAGMARAAANAGDQFFRDAYPLPDSHQVWGSWTKEARRHGKIIPVKGPDGKHKLRQCRKKESHARDSKVYRVR